MNKRRNSRAPFLFVLFTAFLDFLLALCVDLDNSRETMLLTSSIIGLSIAQMAFCLILLIRDLSAWKLLVPGFVVAFLFGLTVTINPQGAEFNRVFAILLITLAIGITPVAIYRVVFVGLKVQFSLSILFGLMTATTVLCAVANQLEFDWNWFWTFVYLFICTAIPIQVAGFMLVGRRPILVFWYSVVISILVMLSLIATLTARSLIDDISLVGQLCGFMSLYLWVGGVILLGEIKNTASVSQAESTEVIQDSVMLD